MPEFRMPSLGADMDAGTLVEWRVAAGDVVHRGDIVAVVDTEKSAIEVEVFDTGVVEELLVDEGAHVPVGTPLARIRGPVDAVTARDGGQPPAATEPPAAPQPPASARPRGPVPAPARPARSGEGAAAPSHSPLVRGLAQTHGIDLATVTGTGPAGEVTRADVQRVVEHGRRLRMSPYARRLLAGSGLDATRIRGTGMHGMIVARDIAGLSGAVSAPAGPPSRAGRRVSQQRVTAALMARSKREIPHYYLRTDIDLTRATAWLADRNGQRPITERVLPSALLLKAVAVAAAQAPDMNGHWVGGAFRPADEVRLGVAISQRGGGLIAPAIAGADVLSVDDLMAALRQLIAAARAGTLRSSHMIEPTITVTNLGDRGADVVYGVIYPPQVALVGFGRIATRPWVADGTVTARTAVTATLAADHRVSDGHRGGRFLATVDRLLQEPAQQ
jgi:pyruvate dehydrogenase E2 component (dihydrolipoamide acetyltransferase)